MFPISEISFASFSMELEIIPKLEEISSNAAADSSVLAAWLSVEEKALLSSLRFLRILYLIHC
jgi:hypothetical protein